MLRVVLTVWWSFFALSASQAQQLYDNGSFTTGPVAENGTVAPTGYEWSETQHEAGNPAVVNAISGFAVTRSAGFQVADDFTVPLGRQWLLSSVVVFGFETDYEQVESPFAEFYFRVWDGPPGAAGSAVVYGDVVTNRLSGSADALTYRIFNTAYPTAMPTGTRRRVWQVRAALPVPLKLPAGTYWLSWQAAVRDGGTNFAVPVTKRGVRTAADANALNFFNNSWMPATDEGQPATGPDVPVALAFTLYGASAVLPVELTAFAARRTTPTRVALIWTTASEKNNVGFTVEKSADGRQWQALGFVAGAGTSGVTHAYAYEDAAAPQPAYYRLRQQDSDGQVQYAPVRFVSAAPAALSVYPNPAHGAVRVAGADPTLPLRLLTLRGQLLRELPAGTMVVETALLAPGLYLLQSGPRVVRLVVE